MSNWYRRWGKRTIDVIATTMALPFTVPLSIAVAALVLYDLGRPVIFAQRRVGADKRPFTLLKFRTMRNRTAVESSAASDAARLTPIGSFLRRSSLDELPEFLNVLRGEMSLIGPRPLLPEYLPRYSERQARRHEVRPGLTGLAQIRGRNTVDWATRLEADVEYVESYGPSLDLRILLSTVPLVISRRGSSARGHATMPEFEGEDKRRED